MALKFGSISTSINKVNRQLNSSLSNTQSLTGAVNQDAAQIQRLASQIGSVNINAREITNGFQSIGSAANNFSSTTNQISSLSGLGSVNVNQLLSSGLGSAVGQLGQIGQIGSVVSNFTNTISGITGAVTSLTSGTTFGQLSSLIGNFDLEQFSTNIINVIPRSLSELAFAVGGDFDTLRQEIEEIGDTSNLEDFVDDTFSALRNSIRGVGVAADKSASRSKIPNPLRNHNSFNYILTLGVLSASEYNRPELYRSNGFNKYIIRSGGGQYSNRYQVLDEAAGNSFTAFGVPIRDHAEYFIDDLEIDAVIVPNSNTGLAMGTTIRFKVTEPYSMGNFVQAIIGSATEQGYDNVIGVPFCLRIDFAGWNEDGETDANFVTAPIFIPINIINMEFNVSGQGSVYDVEAVAYSETGLGDSVNKSMTTINAVGRTVHEVLNGEVNSVSAALNDRIANLEDNDVLSTGDRYIIAFPQKLTDYAEVIAGTYTSPDSLTTPAEQVAISQGLASAPEGEFDPVVVPPSSQLFELLNNFANDTSRMNAIGKSLIDEDSGSSGDAPMGDGSQVRDQKTDTNNSADITLSPNEKSRVHQFHQNDTIVNIITGVLLSSEYAAENATADSDANGTRKWFKIQTQVYIDETETSIDERGRPARIYVYNVITYSLDEAKHCGPNEIPKNTQGLKDSAAKEYNYIYTGVNEDVLDFDINFNLAYITTALSNFAQNPGGAGTFGNKSVITGNDSAQGTSLLPAPRQSESSETNTTIEEVTEFGQNPNSLSRSDNVQLRVAQMFQNTLLNQWSDLITAEMRIIGDPFFLPQQTGNYIGQSAAGSPNLTTDGTMNYMQNEVFVVVNFKTPFDYQIEGATMEFPQVVSQFSGLFSCWAVTNNFSKGRFEQTIKLIRRRGQDAESTTENTGILAIDNSASIVEGFASTDDAALRQQRAQNIATGATFNSDGTVAGSGQAARPGSRLPPVVRAGGVTFDPRTGVFPGQSADSASNTEIFDLDQFRNDEVNNVLNSIGRSGINSQPPIPLRTGSAAPRPTRPGQNTSGQSAIDQSRAQKIDSQQGNSSV